MNKEFLEENEFYSIRFSPELYLTETSWPIRFVERRRILKIVKLIKPMDLEKILDIGCGAGDILIEIKKFMDRKNFHLNSVKLYGIDASRYMVSRAMERIGNSAEIINSIAEDLPFKSNFFDKILCSEVLEHVQDTGKTLTEMSRVLKPGGIFVISYPNEDLFNSIKKISRFLGLMNVLFPGKYRPEMEMIKYWHKRKIDIRVLSQDLLRAGLRIEKVYCSPEFFPLRRIVFGLKYK